MKKILDHIEYVKGKPHHVRHRIAVGTATLGSAIIAFVWLAGSFMTGSFAIEGSSFAASTGQNETVTVANAENSTEGLAGAAAAFQGPSASAPARIEIVDSTPAPSPKKQSDQTILPF